MAACIQIRGANSALINGVYRPESHSSAMPIYRKIGTYDLKVVKLEYVVCEKEWQIKYETGGLSLFLLERF